MAALVSAEGLAVLEQQNAPARGLLAASGVRSGSGGFDLMIGKIYLQRGRAQEHPE